MPEGDSIYQLAARINQELAGHALEKLWTRKLGPRPMGGKLAQAASYGKWLLLPLNERAELRFHLGLRGRARVLARPPRKLAGEAGLLLQTSAGTLVIDELRAADVVDPRRGSVAKTKGLGPDLMADEFCKQTLTKRLALARKRLPTEMPILDVLLNQRIAAGIGKVYKSELLYLHKLWPLTAWGALSDECLQDLYASGRELLLANRAPGFRTTRGSKATSPGSLWVYGRDGEACFRCSGEIARKYWGEDGRVTYLCHRCQRPAS